MHKDVICSNITDSEELKMELSRIYDFYNELRYESFYLENSPNLTEITEKTFMLLEFRSIYFKNNTNLERVDPYAFSGNDYTEYFESVDTVWINNYPNEYNFFSALSAFRNLAKLYVMGSKLSNIPPRAFTERQWHLKIINFSRNEIATIESLAFYDLPNVEYIGLTEERISVIEDKAFVINSKPSGSTPNYFASSFIHLVLIFCLKFIFHCI